MHNEILRLLLDGAYTRGLFAGAMEQPEITIVPLGSMSRMGRAKKKIADERVF